MSRLSIPKDRSFDARALEWITDHWKAIVATAAGVAAAVPIGFGIHAAYEGGAFTPLSEGTVTSRHFTPAHTHIWHTQECAFHDSKGNCTVWQDVQHSEWIPDDWTITIKGQVTAPNGDTVTKTEELDVSHAIYNAAKTGLTYDVDTKAFHG